MNPRALLISHTCSCSSTPFHLFSACITECGRFILSALAFMAQLFTPETAVRTFEKRILIIVSSLCPLYRAGDAITKGFWFWLIYFTRFCFPCPNPPLNLRQELDISDIMGSDCFTLSQCFIAWRYTCGKLKGLI